MPQANSLTTQIKTQRCMFIALKIIAILGLWLLLSQYDNKVIQFIPTIVKGMIIAVAFCGLFYQELKDHPMPFYVVAFIGSIGWVWQAPFSWFRRLGIQAPDFIKSYEKLVHGAVYEWPYHLGSLLTMYSRVVIGVALYFIVMFIGAVDGNSIWLRRLKAIRSELSIFAGFFVLGHVIEVFGVMFIFVNPKYPTFTTNVTFITVYSILGPILAALFLTLWFTSFGWVRKNMTKERWTKIQKLSYPFFAVLIAFGLLLNLSWSMRGYIDCTSAIEAAKAVKNKERIIYRCGQIGTGYASAWIFFSVSILYVVLRVSKYKRDTKKKNKLKNAYENRKIINPQKVGTR